jgi:carbamoyltransferase
MTVLGISCYYHDAAACIIKDGKIIGAAAEERFTRKKHDNNFPAKAIQFCLDTAKISMTEVDVVAFYEKPILKFERILHQSLQHFPLTYKTFITTMEPWFDKRMQIRKILEDDYHFFGPVAFTEHHLSHAASAYYLSGFDKAVVMTLDGVGEWATTTVGTGIKNDIKLDQEIHFPHSLGLFYSTLTAYLGFSVNDAEYKVMGLAAYGDPKPFKKHFDELISLHEDGSYQLNMKYFDFDWSDHMPSAEMIKLFGFPQRKPESDAPQHYKDIAAALQAKLEEVVFFMLKKAYQKYKIKNLCLAGGVALNSVMNGKILKSTPFTDLFIPPDPGDAGGAMGAALYVQLNPEELQYESKKVPAKKFALSEAKKTALRKQLAKNFNPYLGPKYDWHQVQKTLDQHQLYYQLYTKREKLLEDVANLVAKQKIIGWFQGRMEWGPRALGSRSILASAATTEMRDIINEKVKHRELFRPFAPVILENYTEKYFESDKNLSPSARYMLMVYPFKKIGFKHVPAVVHVDGSGRLQTLKRDDNPMYYDLIEKHRKKTGVPIIINTSFNVRGEPIVCSPEDAVQCFLHTDIDYLVIDHFLVRKTKKGKL